MINENFVMRFCVKLLITAILGEYLGVGPPITAVFLAMCLLDLHQKVSVLQSSEELDEKKASCGISLSAEGHGPVLFFQVQQTL